MNTDKQDARIRKAINDHNYWLSKWRKDSSAFTVEMISPRGKFMTHSAYCAEVNKHMDATIGKIRKALAVIEKASK